jgi:sialate O-acetylesterase
MRRIRWQICLGFVGWLAVAATANADVKMPAVFGDNMVLQQKTKAPIWGTADPGEEVTISLGSQKATTKADANGRWSVKVETPAAGGPVEVTVKGKNTITLKNVLVGEVWVCSGQSNMQWSVRASANPDKETAEAKFPKIRLFTVPRVPATEPQSDCKAQWVECSPQAIPDFSAVAYFFGRDLHKTLDVPVGLINTSYGGTAAEAWTSRPTLQSVADFKPIFDRWDGMVENYPKAKEAYEKQLAEWKLAVEKAKADGKDAPKQPQAPANPATNANHYSVLFNGMVNPVVPYAVKGAIWYQGESNAGRAYQYRKLFPTMINDWRKAWGYDFPFLFVQLANFNPGHPEPEDSTAESDWAELREAQSMTLSLASAGQAVIIDIGDAKDIHPKNKQDVGHRLALAAEHIAYGKDIVYSGPVYEKMVAEGSTARLKFKHTGGGLVAEGGPLKGFAVAGADHKFFVAEARIDGDSVVVRSDQVEKPVAIRYAWANNPAANLFNKEGLPASPFRTDDWPGKTVNAK